MEPLSDPSNDREMKDILPPPHKPISDDLLYPNKGNIAFVVELSDGGCSFKHAKLGIAKDSLVQGR